MVSEPSPGDGQGLPCEVRGGGVDLLCLEIVVVEDGDRAVPLDLRKSALSVSWVPGARRVVGVVIGVSRCSITPWVCCLGSLYVPC